LEEHALDVAEGHPLWRFGRIKFTVEEPSAIEFLKSDVDVEYVSLFRTVKLCLALHLILRTEFNY
jgi:hypothetical protein